MTNNAFKISPKDYTDQEELEAEYFALCLLMPTDTMLYLKNSLRLPLSECCYAAGEYFGVEPSKILLRIKYLVQQGYNI